MSCAVRTVPTHRSLITAALWARFVMGSWRAAAMPACLIDRRFLGIVCRSALHNHCVFPPLCNWPPTASHKEGPRCWRLIFRRQRCLRTCETAKRSFIDGFAQSLERSGYRPAIAVRYLRAAAHLGHFVCEQGGTLADINLAAFHEHLRTCRCPRAKGGRRNHHTTFGAKNFRNFLQQIGVHRTQCDTRYSKPRASARCQLPTLAAQASRCRRTDDPTVRSWGHPPDDGAWHRSHRVERDSCAAGIFWNARARAARAPSKS